MMTLLSPIVNPYLNHKKRISQKPLSRYNIIEYKSFIIETKKMSFLNSPSAVKDIININPSEGEEFLKSFFDELGIKCETEKVIPDLKGDDKQHRRADFYLPDYKVYVEFFGLWNTNKSDEYRKKKAIYELNNIPCIYIYPGNLGIIKFIFDKRLQNELKKRNFKKELYRYRFFKFKKSGEYKYYL